jgi:hypothetical protein
VINSNIFLLNLVEPPDRCLDLEPVIFVKAKEGNSFAQLDIGNSF